MRKRLRSTCKWGGTAATVLLLVVWVGSAWWRGAVIGSWFELVVQSGCIVLSFYEPDPGFPANVRWIAPRQHNGSLVKWIHPIEATDGIHTQWGLWIPIWLLAILPAAVSVMLWRGDLRPKQGCCRKCGFDLRGADHKVCPECGGVATNRA